MVSKAGTLGKGSQTVQKVWPEKANAGKESNTKDSIMLHTWALKPDGL